MKALAVVGAITLVCAYLGCALLVIWPAAQMDEGSQKELWFMAFACFWFATLMLGALTEHSNAQKEKK